MLASSLSYQPLRVQSGPREENRTDNKYLCYDPLCVKYCELHQCWVESVADALRRDDVLLIPKFIPEILPQLVPLQLQPIIASLKEVS